MCLYDILIIIGRPIGFSMQELPGSNSESYAVLTQIPYLEKSY